MSRPTPLYTYQPPADDRPTIPCPPPDTSRVRSSKPSKPVAAPKGTWSQS